MTPARKLCETALHGGPASAWARSWIATAVHAASALLGTTSTVKGIAAASVSAAYRILVDIPLVLSSLCLCLFFAGPRFSVEL